MLYAQATAIKTLKLNVAVPGKDKRLTLWKEDPSEKPPGAVTASSRDLDVSFSCSGGNITGSTEGAVT